MKNNYGLNSKELDLLRKQYKVCAYCKKRMLPSSSKGSRKDWATIEHLNYVPPWNNIETVVFCCWSCNSSRGNKKIKDWLNSDYCKVRKIKLSTVASAVKKYVTKFERK